MLVSFGHLPLAGRTIAVAQARLAVLQRLLDAVDQHQLCRRAVLERVAVPDDQVGAAAQLVLIDGVQQPLENRQTRLRDRYRTASEGQMPKAYEH